MNDFVNYLNSTNNVGGNSTGSLAEIQVKSCYYDSVKVDRKLGTYITDCIQNGDHKAFILTGHAGDGKTSILVQVLKNLGRLQASEGLLVQNEYDDFLYFKDMSEIKPEKQAEALQMAVTAPAKGKTSLLISNTGPLLKGVEAMVRAKKKAVGSAFTPEDRLKLQSLLLRQLDENGNSSLNIEGFEFVLVNIARVDNVPFAGLIMKKILEPQLWAPCSTCVCAERCPIKNNYEIVATQFDRVTQFVENYYRFLYENDKRMTIRQMVGQISYALTGNLTCEYIAGRYLKEPFFVYNFANLFFGYNGLKKAKDVAQIKGIGQLQNLELDRVALDADYSLFVSQDYSCFLPKIQKELTALLHRNQKHYQITDETQLLDEKKHEEELRLRRAVRRFYLLFSLCESEEESNHVMDQIFGAPYTEYKRLISGKQPRLILKRMQSMVFEALYIKNTGYLSEDKNTLPLTLRREDDVFQNVMIVLGEVNRGDLEVIQTTAASHFEDVDSKFDLYLQLGQNRFKLSLPMITYFNNLINGAISSNNNPALTHGIAQLDALLLEQYGDKPPKSEEDCELSVIINTTQGQVIKRFSFENNQLSI
ncbi:hypothetical protein [Anaeromassilibacillus senegalensis]|uniref:hypothetical protein n=1 Tax=Anaeromassilibacillus senegalensis TaxID=1673717 RepID=UPI000680DDDF|nr:hypothetical protein [Anaeromassilibacillus senegalensis]